MANPSSTLRTGLAGLALALAAATTAGCVAEPTDTLAQEAARPGPWRLSAETERIGNTQYVSYDAAPAWNPANCAGGITRGGQLLADFLNNRFPQIQSIGGYACRQNTADLSQMSVHGTGRALDIMLRLDHGDADNDDGDPIGAYLIEHAEQIGIQYIIWDHMSWGAYRSAPKLQSYGGPIPHIDHLHVEITIEASRLNTPWFNDADGDGVNNDRDNCDDTANAMQTDTDGDGIGNACDNCPRVANRDQADRDRDGVGTVCDNCPGTANAMQVDDDSDGRGNACDNCPNVAQTGQADLDGDGRGNVCDSDLDGDTVANAMDNCPNVPNSGQADANMDGIGDRCQADDDADGVDDTMDNCRAAPNTDQLDTDHDGRGDACDADLDGDTIENDTDNCAQMPNADQSDRDRDDLGDVCDSEPDGPTMPVDDGPDPVVDADGGVTTGDASAGDASSATDAASDGGPTTGTIHSGCSASPTNDTPVSKVVIAMAAMAVAIATRTKRRDSTRRE